MRHKVSGSLSDQVKDTTCKKKKKLCEMSVKTLQIESKI